MSHDLRAAMSALEPLVLAAHTRHAQAVTFTRTGRIMLSTGQDAQIRLWSVPGFKSVGAIVGHRNSVNSVAFSVDEQMLATSSSDGTVRVWSFPEGQCDQVFQKQTVARFSPTGKYLATLSTKGQVSLWDPRTGELVASADPVDRRAVALEFSPDERELLVGGTGTIHRLSVPGLSPLGDLAAHEAIVASLRVSPDGATLVSTGGPGSVRFWSTDGWRELGTVPLETPGGLAVAFAPNSSEVSVSVDFHIITLSVRDRAVTANRRVGAKGVYGLAYSPDGKYLANAAADGRVRVWTLR
jgi:WD40 repeat protein